MMQGCTGRRQANPSLLKRSAAIHPASEPDAEDKYWSKKDERLYWDGLDGNDAAVRPFELGMQDRNYTLQPRRAFSTDVMGDAFEKFSAQCSHNTYMWGTQLNGLKERANSVHPKALYVALGLGYRCIEIDVWRRNKPRVQPLKERWDGPTRENMTRPLVSQVKVAHQIWNGVKGVEATGRLTNQVDLTLFVQQVLLWCETDERNFPATELLPKLPIVISIENHGRTELTAAYMRVVFGWFGDRIIRPDRFPPGTPMSAVAATSGKRFIILKSRTISTFALAPIVAMNEEAARGTYLSKSVKMESKKPSEENVESIRELISEGKLVRTYPCNEAWNSKNYNPGLAFDARAQMVCVNFQGKCPSAEAVCREPVRGEKDSEDCECERDFAASLEAAFLRWGYDGYIHYPSLSERAWRELRHLRP
eukprot:TRINITY_DN8447_c0_g1_i1.p1 TRINITY_DN8447_c0_g1~~TRINITY_DN8447_c0_g1_i1.p1  ORF type:complete len:444 (+),score=37.26 TRINITY_DN8447_c0_g1_i1:69-1334(+)